MPTISELLGAPPKQTIDSLLGPRVTISDLLGPPPERKTSDSLQPRFDLGMPVPGQPEAPKVNPIPSLLDPDWMPQMSPPQSGDVGIIGAGPPLISPPTVTASDLSVKPGFIAKAVAGINQGASALVQGLTDPNALVAIGAGGTIPALSKPVAAAFLGQMGLSLPGQVAEAAKAFGEGDVERGVAGMVGVVSTPILMKGIAKSLMGETLPASTPKETASTLLKEATQQAAESGAPITASVTDRILRDTSKIGETLESSVAKEPDAPAPAPAPAPATEAGMREGPGAQTAGKDLPLGSQLDQLTRAVSESVDQEASTPTEAVKLGKTWGEFFAEGKDAIPAGYDKVKATAQAMWDWYRKPAEYSDYRKIKGEWQGAGQEIDYEVMQWVKFIEKDIPSPVVREGIVNYIQADGDAILLRDRADKSNDKNRPGYEAALRLTDQEKNVANLVRSYLDTQLQEGISAGILEHGVENYITQIWKEPNKITGALQSDIDSSALKPDFQYARKRIFDSYFEGEQHGKEAASKDIRALVGAYDKAFRQSIVDRAFIKNLTKLKASDGRPAIAVSGTGSPVPKGGPTEAVLVDPDVTKAEASDYQTVDHPALRKWKWTTEVDGVPILIKGDMKVHPEFYKDVRNALETSRVRQNRVGKALLNVQSAIKQIMFSMSGFHQMNVDVHAIGHKVSPLHLEEIDFKNPLQKSLVNHGLQIASMDARELFEEGLGGSDFWSMLRRSLDKLPENKLVEGVSSLLKRAEDYTDWLFTEHIPRLKMTMALEAYKRNSDRYGDKLTESQIQELTANQANAAFGEQNYKMLGRSKTTQDLLRLVAIAPDFLESRLQFVGQGMKPYGREQFLALGRLALGQYFLMRLMNQAFSDDPHFEKPFSFIYKGREYGVRTIPEDIYRLSQDTRKFVYNRLSPLVGRAGITAMTGRDDRGVERNLIEQLGDIATSWIPISMRTKDDVRMWESFLGAFGVHTKGYSATQEIGKLASDWGKKNLPKKAGEFIYDYKNDPLRKIRVALQMKEPEEASKVIKEMIPADYQGRADEIEKLNRAFEHRSKTGQALVEKTFTGSSKNELAFKATLTPAQLEMYQKAIEEGKDLAYRYRKAMNIALKL